jgi:predicted phage terminase large subunit-like protein
MYLLHVFRQRLEYPKLKLHIKSLAKRWDADQILIEDKGAGTSLIQDLRNSTSLSITHFVPKEDKGTRMMAVSPLIESAQVFIPKEAPWLATFQHEIATFPKGKHDDQVDSMSQFLHWARNRYKYTGPFEIIVGRPSEIYSNDDLWIEY